MPDPLRTGVAAARWDDNLFCGNSVRDALAGNITAWSSIALAVRHRALTPDEEALLDDVVVCALAADPRIWPLKIVRLLSSYGHVTTGTIAGMYCTEAARIGWRAYFIAGEFLASLAACPDPQARRAEVEARLSRKETLPGYGVAHRRQDERATALAACLANRGRTGGKHWTIASEVDAALASRGIRINMGAAGAAVLLDLGFSVDQLLALGPYLVYPNYLANAVEGAKQAPRILRQLPEATLDDRTPPPRKSPRAQSTRRT